MAKILNSYFPHDSNARNDIKVRRLRKVFGVEGYGIYWILIEVLREEEGFKYPLDSIDLLADEINISVEKVVGIVKNFGLFEIDEEQNFFSISLIARMQPYLEKSEKARLSVNKRWENARKTKKDDTNVLLPYNERNTMVIQIEENRIEENRIEENTLVVPTTETVKNLWNSFAKNNGLSEVITISKKRETHIKARYSEKGFNLSEIFGKVKQQSFLLGENKNEWKMNFDWLFGSRNNYLKILENSYMGGSKPNSKRENELLNF